MEGKEDLCTLLLPFWQRSTLTSCSVKHSGVTRCAETRVTARIPASAMEAAIALSSIPVGEHSCSPLERSAHSFVIHGRALRVVTRDPWVRELLNTTYAPLAQAASRVHYSVDISPCGGFADAFYAVRDCFAAFAAQTPGCVAFYAACVAVNERAVLFVGRSTIGKTILSLNLRTCGARFLGDELMLLNLSDGTISAVARTPALREPGLPYLLDGAMRSRIASCNRALRTERGRLWYALDSETLGFDADGHRYPLSAVHVVSQRDSRVRLREIPFAEGFTALAQRTHRGTASLHDLAALHAVVRDIPLYELTVGPPQETVDVLLERLAACV
jgi:hypothetical protein